MESGIRNQESEYSMLMKTGSQGKGTIKLIIASSMLLVFTGCHSSLEQSGESKNPDFKQALWITDSRVWPVTDSLMYGDFPAPIFRKEFSVKDGIKSATLYITAAGYYHSTLNGRMIGEKILDPAWTNFSKRVYYSVYDLTSDILPGKNCMGTTLGNGFYNPLPMKMWSTYNLRDYLPVGKPSFIAKLKIVYNTGEVQELNTDASWKFSYGPVTRNSVYLGEVYDASRETGGWDLPGFNDTGWSNSVPDNGPGGKLEKAFFPPVRVTAKFNPVKIYSPTENTWIADMGVNFTGLYNIRLRGEPGDTVTFRFGERIYEDGTLNPMTSVAGQIKRINIRGSGANEATWNSAVFNTDNGPGCPPVAWQTDRYIFGGKTEVRHTPLFTFHVFRYMEITGLNYKPDPSDIEALVFHSDVENENSFSCSSDLINSIQTATRRTFLDNLISVQSDCPGKGKIRIWRRFKCHS